MLLWCSATGALMPSAPRGIPPEVVRVLDSALTLLGMSRTDLWLPCDAVEPDAYRLPQVCAFFEQPLQLLPWLEEQRQLLLALRPSTLEQSARQWVELLTGTAPMLPTYEQRLSARELDSLLRFNLERRLGLIGATVLRQYLVPCIEAQRELLALRSRIPQLPLLAELADSLLMLSEESATASLFELKAQELWALERARQFFTAAASVEWERWLAPMLGLWRAIWAAVERNSPPLERYRDSIHTTILETPFGRVAFGGPGNDTYTGEFLLIVDVGGDDRYLLPALSKEEALAQPVRVIVDLAGNDLYHAGSYSLGAGFWGCGILIDWAGNDVYAAGDFSLGSAVAGVGVLLDRAGTDQYLGGVHTQGAGAFGIGVLLDLAGNDLYRCAAHAQGFGFVRGYGALVDMEGNDLYLAHSPYVDVLRYDQHFLTFTQGAALGYRPLASGGVGILLDSAGNDLYVSDIYGQGTAYWYGVGALLDCAGDDRYIAHQYAQGSGVHLAFGVLWDRAGDDLYRSYGVSQGCGHDIAAGILLDEAGEDVYSAESLSQGAGNANAISLLLDLHGDDAYSARQPNTMGYSDLRRSYGMIGIFADAQGRDWYGDTTRNGRVRLQSTYGVLLDAELLEPLPPPPRPGIDVPDSLRMPLAGSLDSLFVQASAAPQKFQYIVEPARERIVSFGAQALPFLASKLSTESARERLALESILPRIYARDSAAVARLLLDSLRSDNPRTLALVATVVGRVRLRAARAELERLLGDPVWRIRALAAQQLGELGDPGAISALRPLLRDEHPLVRARAAFALLQLQPRQLEVWQQALADPSQLVRYGAVQGALRHGRLPATLVQELWRLPLELRARQSLGWLVASVDTAASPRTFARLLQQQPAPLRRVAYSVLRDQRSPWSARLRAECARLESDPALRELLQ
jgi:hypothetical protein